MSGCWPKAANGPKVTAASLHRKYRTKIAKYSNTVSLHKQDRIEQFVAGCWPEGADGPQSIELPHIYIESIEQL